MVEESEIFASRPLAFRLPSGPSHCGTKVDRPNWLRWSDIARPMHASSFAIRLRWRRPKHIRKSAPRECVGKISLPSIDKLTHVDNILTIVDLTEGNYR